MARTPNESVGKAKELFDQGLKLIEIANRLNLPPGTVRRWKSTYKWGGERSGKSNERSKSRGGQPGNKNAVGDGAPKGNKNAEKYGFFSKYLPDETLDIFNAVEKANPLDLLWHQIQIAYAAIIRAQKIAYVKDREDKTAEGIWEVQQAWDKQENFLKAQARAQGELARMIKQYDEMLHRDWELATNEQKARIELLRAQTEKITGDNMEVEDMDDIEGEIYGSD